MRLRDRRQFTKPEVMIIPMIDIMFFLLVFFMISTLYMVDSSSLFVVSISGKLYHLMLNNESQLVCDVENVLSLWAVFNKHTIGSQLQSSLQSLDVHDGCIQRGSLCINALPHSLQEIVDSDHSRETINDQRHTTTTWIDSKTAETSYTGLH